MPVMFITIKRSKFAKKTEKKSAPTRCVGSFFFGVKVVKVLAHLRSWSHMRELASDSAILKAGHILSQRLGTRWFFLKSL